MPGGFFYSHVCLTHMFLRQHVFTIADSDNDNKECTLTYVGVAEAVEQGEEQTLERGESEAREWPQAVLDRRHAERPGDRQDVVRAKKRQQHECRLHGFPMHTGTGLRIDGSIHPKKDIIYV